MRRCNPPEAVGGCGACFIPVVVAKLHVPLSKESITNGYIPPYGEDKMAGFIRTAAKILAGG
jgi:hypothetical protein